MGKEVQKWADEAMFEAEKLRASEGPKVYLLAMSHDPLGQIAAACKMYKGEVVRNLADVTDDERRHYLEEVSKTKLKAPFEFVKFHFLFEGVTRSFTHQMVRQRTAAYAQESLRFAVKVDMAEGVALPPSIAGTERLGQGNNLALGAESNNETWMRNVWDQAVQEIEQAYLHLVDAGMPAEDARGLLPHNITTRLHYTTDLRALQDHAGNRLCTQAQFEWRVVWSQIMKAIREYDADWDQLRRWHLASSGEDKPESPDRWQFEALSDLFRPVCYLTGRCEFKAQFDRKCKIRNRVDANEKIARPSSQWDEDYTAVEHGSYIHGVDDPRENTVLIGAIKPAEWLLDPGAAR